MKTVASAILMAFFANGQTVPVDPAAQVPVDPAAQVPVEPAVQVPAEPHRGPPQEPGRPLPPPPLTPVDPGSFTCEMNTCAGHTLNVAASQGWQFICDGNCAGLTINLEVGYDPMKPGEIVDYIDSIHCPGPGSCAGLILNVANAFCDPANPTLITRQVEINDLRCEGPGACDGMQINAQCGVDIMKTNFDCQKPGTCVGCIVRNAFELKSCDQNQNPNGAMTMPWEVPYLGLKAPGPFRPQNQIPMLPAYGPWKTNAGVPNYQNGYMQQPVPQAPIAPVPQQPAQPQQPQQPAQPAQPQGPPAFPQLYYYYNGQYIPYTPQFP